MSGGCFPSNRMGKLFSRPKSSRPKSSKYAVPDELASSHARGGQVRRFPAVHEDSVMCVIATRRNVCLSGSKDNSVSLFDFEEGRQLQSWRAHTKEVTKVAHSPSHDLFVSGSRDKSVCVWRADDAQPCMNLQGHDLVVTGLAINPGESVVCSGSRDNSMRLWDLFSGSCINQNTESRNLVTHVKYSHDGSSIAQTGEDKEVKLWDAATLQITIRFPRKQYIQTCCDVSADDRYVLSTSNGFGGQGCEATLWDIRQKAIVCEYKGHAETVGACAYVPSHLTPENTLFLTASNDCSVRLWNQQTQECLASLALCGSGPLTSIAVFENLSVCVASLNQGVFVLQLVKSTQGEWLIQHTAQF